MPKKSIIKTLYFRYLYTITWTIIILYLSLGRIKSVSPGKLDIPHLDKLVHFTMYFVYTFFLLFETRVKYVFKSLILVMLYAICFGVLMEILQSVFFVYRSGDIYDALFNALGVIVMVILYPKLEKTIMRYLVSARKLR